MRKRTKIVCTLGPASESLTAIEKMVKAGMNVARLNFSHGTYENHRLLLNNVRKVARKTDEPVAVMADLQGPKIRVGVLPIKGIELKTGDLIVFTAGISLSALKIAELNSSRCRVKSATLAARAASEIKDKIIPVDFSDLPQFVKKGERLLLDDGRIETKIIKVSQTEISAIVINGGKLTSHKGINAPDSKIVASALTEKDKEDVLFAVKEAVDFIALSFVTAASDVLDLRFLIKECEKKLGIKPEQQIRIIAKIERKEAVKNIKEILNVADGIMIARGDLGVEMPPESVPLIQKQLIDEALSAAKPVIVATQMLDSMQTNPRPTRAEVSDVANAVIDHADAVMLSNETATGKYPVETVKMMKEIIIKTEQSAYDDLIEPAVDKKKKKVDEVMTELSRFLAEQVEAKLILAASLTGETARLISRHRPELSIVVVTNTERVRSQLNLSWGVLPFILKPCRTIEELVERSVIFLKKKKVAQDKDKIIVVAGEPVGQAGQVNLLEVREVK